MSYAAERAAIEARMRTGWASTPLVFENQEYTPTSGTAFVYCRIVNQGASQVEFGLTSALHRHYGLISVTISVPYGTGLGIAHTYARTIGAIFRGMQFSSIVCKSAFIAMSKREGEWYQIELVVPFHRDTILAVVGVVPPVPSPMDVHFDTPDDMHIGAAGDEHIDM